MTKLNKYELIVHLQKKINLNSMLSRENKGVNNDKLLKHDGKAIAYAEIQRLVIGGTFDND